MQASELRGQKIFTLAHHLKCEAPNAGRQPLPEAGAQRTLEAVGWTPMLGAASV
jgi:hypothetical protein